MVCCDYIFHYQTLPKDFIERLVVDYGRLVGLLKCQNNQQATK